MCVSEESCSGEIDRCVSGLIDESCLGEKERFVPQRRQSCYS